MLAEDAEVLGIQLPKEDAEDEEDPEFPVDPDNWDAVEAFCRCATQWHYGPMGGVLGMNYPGVKCVLELTQKKAKRGELFTAIQVMERAAMAVMNRKSN
ncbi:DUF1799 domain-containing protein [Methylomicrobium sp. Wu6]|uniref:DUF1799 domain-containing protein n=1 Tax=Methylomicrobium sp. Wu6 TaxID=3107928 RepID=UPI002DD6747E|nr:DUF1799 domain-containing protein [Methylomicrobium sp. Wu6]MEC4750052.1 DUF1799 domain-containing protein [Methylomicrobium sp. Wu6]